VKIAIAFAALALAGCATTRAAEPAVEVRTVEVRVPVAVRCVDPADVPAEPAQVGSRLSGQAAHDADLLASSAIQLRQWGRELRALITPCMRD
jgi:hypothetical protein